MITERDRKILNYLYIYKYITLEQLEKIFFKDIQYSYNVARRRMQALLKTGYIGVTKSKVTKKNIYFLKEDSFLTTPSEEELIFLDVLSFVFYKDFKVLSAKFYPKENNSYGIGDINIQTINEPKQIIVIIEFFGHINNIQNFILSKEFTNLIKLKSNYNILLISDTNYVFNSESLPIKQLNTNLTNIGEYLDILLQ